MNIKTSLFCILISSAMLPAARAGVLRHYDVSAGLSDNISYDIVRDKDGVVWVGTNDGLSRIDSQGITCYRSSSGGGNGLIAKSISLHEDGKQIWIGGADSLYLFDPYREAFTAEALDMIFDVCLNPSDGSLWIATMYGLFRKEEGQASTMVCDDRRFVCIYPARNGQMILGAEDGLYCWMDSSSSPMKLADTEDEVTAIACGSTDNTLVFGTFGGQLFEYNHTSRNCQEIILRDSRGERLSPTRIHDIVYFQYGQGIIAADNGLIVCPEKDDCWSFSSGELASESIYRIFMDDEGGYWYCSFFGGVYYSSRKNQRISCWTEEGVRGSMKGKSVSCIKEGCTGNLWITTENGGLNSYDRSSGRFTDYSTKSHSNLHDVLQEGDDLWTATFGKGIDRVNLKTGKVSHYDCRSEEEKYTEGNCAYCFLRTKKGELMVGTLSGIFSYDSVLDSFVQIPEMKNVFTSGLIEDYGGNIWAVSQYLGVYRRDSESGEWHNYNPESGRDFFVSAFLNTNGALWFGTRYSGIYRYDEQVDSLVRDHMLNALLPGGPLETIFQDGGGDFWFSTTRGIVHLDPKSGKTDLLTVEDGLPCNQFIRGSVCQTKDEALWFGSLNGICSFTPDIFDYKETPPMASVNRIDFKGRDGNLTGFIRPSTLRVKVPRGTRRIVFHLNNSSFAAPGRNVFRWRFCKDWNETRECIVEIERIGRGVHPFEFKCCNSDGEWSRETYKIEMVTKAPLAWSYAAIALYCLLASLAAALLIRRRRSNPEMSGEGSGAPLREKTFIGKVDEVILAHLGDATFNVQSLADEMGMSRSNLQRKFSEIIGVSPRDHIRKLRLEKASEYLSSNSMRINEVAYKVGFINLSYFSKSFREEFGVSPKQYREKGAGKN